MHIPKNLSGGHIHSHRCVAVLNHHLVILRLAPIHLFIQLRGSLGINRHRQVLEHPANHGLTAHLFIVGLPGARLPGPGALADRLYPVDGQPFDVIAPRSALKAGKWRIEASVPYFIRNSSRSNTVRASMLVISPERLARASMPR